MKLPTGDQDGGANPTEAQAIEQPGGGGIPGGKALLRLHLLEDQRGIQESDVEHAETERPLAQSLISSPNGDEGRELAGIPDEQTYSESPYLTALEQKVEPRVETGVPVPVAWHPIGPFSIPHGQTYGKGPRSRPSVSGRISSVAIDPGDPAHILIGAAAGGVWESRDGGKHWDPRTDDQPALAVGAVVFDPTNPQFAYAGLGEGNFYRRFGTGLLRSTDGGTTWGVHATTPFVGLGFYDLVVDPQNNNHLLAATTAQLAESTNGGSSWSVRRSRLTWNISMHPAPPVGGSSIREVFAACNDGLVRSTNGGTNWSAVPLPGAPGTFTRLEVRHAPSNGDVVYVFGAGAGSGFLWRRNSAGGGFSAIPVPPGLNINQAWYDWFLAVAPNNPDVVYLGEIGVQKGVRSPNGSWSWTNIAARQTGDSIHPDQHAIAFSPVDPNVVFIGNDGGIYRSPDAGTTWDSLNRGLNICEFQYMAQHPLYDAWLIGGTQDNGTMRYEGGDVWYHVADGDGGDCGVNASSPYTCFHTYYGMGMERSTTGGAWGSWSWIGPNVPAGYDALFYPPMEVKDNVVAQAGQSVFVSSNNGSSWTELHLPGGVGTASSMDIPSTSRVLVGTTQGNIFRIDRVGGNWLSPIQLTRPRAGWSSDIEVDPGNSDRIWASYSTISGSHLFRSDNGGTNWTDVSAGLPGVPVNGIAIDPANPDTVYVGGDVGVQRTTDAGATWTDFSNGLPNVFIGDLLFHAPSRLLRAGTRNRGIWEIEVDATSVPDVQVYLRDSIVDTGRSVPSASGGSDPFKPGAVISWNDCRDVKVDSSPFQTGSISDVNFEFFEDDRGVFAAGLKTEPGIGQSRIFVQVHNRGPKAAENVSVRLFYADAASIPNLPSGFWNGFPNNSMPVASAWQPVGPHQTVPTVATGRPQVVGFDWMVPGSPSGSMWLLAIVSAVNDPISTGELDVSRLVRDSRQCGLKKIDVQAAAFSGVQWTGTVQANATRRWYTQNWPADWHVAWTVVPTTQHPDEPQVSWKVQVQRTSVEHVTYWIRVTNLTSTEVDIEGRYCVLSQR